MRADSKAGDAGRARAGKWLGAAAVGLVHVAAAGLIYLYLDDWARAASKAWMRGTPLTLLALFRAAGRWPGVVLGAFLLWRLKERGARWGLALLAAAVVMSVAAEGLGRCVCRVRPRGDPAGSGFSEPFSRFGRGEDRGSSFPSGDASVAFTAACVLSAAAPRGRAAFYALALGSAFWRMGSGSHYLSDCYVSALLGYYNGLVWLKLLGPGCGRPGLTAPIAGR